jgi:hypothetical protein
MATAVIKGSKNYNIVKIRKSKTTIKIDQTLPFRVKFTNIMVPSYGSGSGAPIGIAIIGFSNYIL